VRDYPARRSGHAIVEDVRLGS